MTPEERIGDVERELLVEQYKLLREETLVHIRMHTRRIVGGLAALGVVIGYTIASGHLWLIALTPFVLGIIIVDAVNASRFMASLSRQLVDIETVLSEEAELFCWESRFGGIFGREPELFGGPRTVRWLQNLSTAVVAVIGYGFLLYVSWVFWPERPQGFGFVSQFRLGVLYVIFTVYLFGTAAVGMYHVLAVAPPSGNPG